MGKYLITFVLLATLIVVGVYWWQVGEESGLKVELERLASCSNTVSEAKFAGKRVLWIDSYHRGYAWSDGIEESIKKVFKNTPVILKDVHLNAKRHFEDEQCKRNALRVIKEVERFKPDVIIASDDHAQKYVVVPYLKGGDIPVIFCGVNWSVEEYGYPAKNVTGMIEVDLVDSLMEYLRRYAAGDRIAHVSVDDLTERKVFNEQNKRFFNGRMKCFLAPERTFKSFKKMFIEAQKNADVIILSNNAGIADWDEKEAEKFFIENTTKPTGAINSWMPGYAMVTFCKYPEEQGEWAAITALKILSGKPISEIPITENKEGKLILNMDIAEKMNILFYPDMLRNSEIYKPREEVK